MEKTAEQLAAEAAAAAEAQAAADAAQAAADAAAAEEAAAIAELEAKAAAEKDDAAAKALLREVMKRKEKQKLAEDDAAAAKQKVAELEAQLNKFAGINLDEVTQLLKDKADRERADAEAKGEWERVKQMMADDHKKEADALKAQIASFDTTLATKDSVINDLLIGNSFASSTYITGELTLTPNKARQLYGSHFEIKDGSVVAYDKPAGKADRTPLVDASGKNLNFEAAMEKIIDADPEKATLLRVKLAPGAASKTASVETPTDNSKLYGASRILAAIAKEKK